MAHISWRILKREEDMCDKRNESPITNRKIKKKFYQNLEGWVKLFNRCFKLKNLTKYIKILLKK